MRIAMLAPISWRVPPRHYGPWERMVSILTEGLVDRGVHVTLFATADSITRAHLSAVCPRPFNEDPQIVPKVWECLHISEVFEHADEFDVIHNHFDFLPLSYSGLVDTPVVTTIHGFSSPGILPVFEKYNGRAHYVAISEADRSPKLDYIATIHHGLPVDEYDFSDAHGEDLLFYGRIHPDKGVAEAIEVARASGRRLTIAGIIHDHDYYEQHVAPKIDGDRVRYLGSVGREQGGQLLRTARALLHLIHFEEPFGLSVVEAMASGTPVIAYDRGAVRETVRDGETGFIVSSVPEAVDAVSRIEELDRSMIRRHVEHSFSSDRMVERYLEVYREVVHRSVALSTLKRSA
jgi:glycosyltransferase involved in cell wall biosynthesis